MAQWIELILACVNASFDPSYTVFYGNSDNSKNKILLCGTLSKRLDLETFATAGRLSLGAVNQ